MSDIKSFEKKCTIKYNSKPDKAPKKYKKLFDTENYEIRASKFGNMIDIRTKKPFEEINEYTDENGKSIKCGTHNRYKKSCPICKEAAGVA